MAEVYLKCPKCGSYSGDSWDQCKKDCPVPGSPYFNDSTHNHFGDLIEVTQEDFE
jgi:hypothetical protein